MRPPAIVLAAALSAWAAPALAQSKPGAPTPAAQAAAQGITTPDDYVIGAGDVLIVTFWRDKDMTGEAVVRPGGMITLPLLNDITAAGLKPAQLSERLKELAVKAKLYDDPSITVGVKIINSRKVFITGGVGKAGPYDLMGPMSVLQLISLAGGLREFVDGKNILINRTEGGKQVNIRFNFKEFSSGKNLQQNISLKPGDTVVVPE